MLVGFLIRYFKIALKISNNEHFNSAMGKTKKSDYSATVLLKI